MGNENFDFRKQADQEKFENLPAHEKEWRINIAQEEAGRQNLNREGSVERHSLKPITPEMLIENKDLLEKVYKQLTEEKRFTGPIISNYRQVGVYDKMRIDYHGEIDFGEGFDKPCLEDVLFYSGIHLQLVRDDVEEYLKLLYTDPPKSNEFIESKLATVSEEAKKVGDFIKQGFDLSTIIPNAPALVYSDKGKVAKEAEGRTSSQDTQKVLDIIKEDSVRSELEVIFKGKTVVELGAGGIEAGGLKVSGVLGCENYVGVEPFNTTALLRGTQFTIVDYLSGDGYEHYFKALPYKHFGKIHLAKADMKSFLEKMPDKLENVVVLISGIDKFILRNEGMGNLDTNEDRVAVEGQQEYLHAVHREILRVLGSNSVVVMYSSPEFYFPELESRRITLKGGESDVWVCSNKK